MCPLDIRTNNKSAVIQHRLVNGGNAEAKKKKKQPYMQLSEDTRRTTDSAQKGSDLQGVSTKVKTKDRDSCLAQQLGCHLEYLQTILKYVDWNPSSTLNSSLQLITPREATEIAYVLGSSSPRLSS